MVKVISIKLNYIERELYAALSLIKKTEVNNYNDESNIIEAIEE